MLLLTFVAITVFPTTSQLTPKHTQTQHETRHRLYEDENPSWAETRTSDKFIPTVVFSAIMVSIYIIWYLWYLCKAISAIRRMPPPFLFVFIITLFTFIATCVGFYMGSFYPIPSAPIAFLGLTGMYNLYVWTLAFIYAPLTSNQEDYASAEYDVEVNSDVSAEGDDSVNTLATKGIGDMQL